jgi:hypothetical protein
LEPLDPDKIGIRIAALRLARGRKQKELAAKVGYKDATALWKVEAGKTMASLDKLMRLGQELETKIDWLLSGGPGGPIPDPLGDHSQVHVNIVLLARKAPDLTQNEIAVLSRHMMRHPLSTVDDLNDVLTANRDSRQSNGTALDKQIDGRGHPRPRKPLKKTRPKPGKTRAPDDKT